MTEPEPRPTHEGAGVPIAAPHARAPAVERDGHSPFPVVAVGASAGGLDAFRGLLGALPEHTGMAFLFVQHLDPNHPSRLVDLLSRMTALPVSEAADGLAVQPDHVYVIPPNSNLAVVQGVLVITPRGNVRGPHLPIDFLFRSLAEEQQARAIGVVLSGTGSDGTLGLCEIKAVGGITFAQDEQTASQAGMPRSAIDSGCVDFVLPVQEIARRLGEIGHHPYLSAPALTARFEEAQAEAQYKKILTAVRAVKNVDFSQYRDTTIKRRIMRRMALHGQRSLAEYARFLDGNRPEVEALYQDLLINVTSFFRDPEVFDALKGTVFPELVKAKFPSAPVRVWVPGCSTGQEAYSIAIALVEFFEERTVRPPIQVFATDLSDQTALEKARAGLYPETIEAEVSPERLRRFFRREDHLYRIDKRLRDMCIFARQNVTADPPFSHLDLISCRNVLIYLATPLQKRVLPTFHYALNMPGYLMLGTAETVGDDSDLFELVDREHRIYAKRAAVGHPPVRFAAGERRGSLTASRQVAGPVPTPVEYQRETDRLLLNRYSPAGVLVNENFDVVQFRGRTSPYLEVPPGEPTTNVLKMAREGLLIELRNALAEAKKRGQPVRREKVRVRAENGVHEIAVDVTPVRVHGGASACYLVIFDDATRPERPGEPPAPLPVEAADGSETAHELERMRQELTATKEYMQSLVEQQDAANEELRSANEEILSSNEELQSTNEELETAKEELQSANEELSTVNEQLQHRNAELSQVNNDLTNLLASTNIPVVMVGGDLRIRRFTQPARKVMSLLSTDIGRPIGDLRPAAHIPEFEQMIAEVIETMQPRQREMQAGDGTWFAVRISPYRTSDNRIDGAVIVLVDIDQAERAEERLRDADRRKDEFLAMLAQELRNPLAPIRNATEILNLRPEDPEAVRFARGVLGRQVDQLARLVDDFIDVQRIVERKVDLRLSRISLESVVEVAVAATRPLLEARRHQLDLALPAQRIDLLADPARLAQVFVHLLGNAARYMEPGGRIWLAAERAAPPGGVPEQARVSVRDVGTGIEPGFLPYVFDRFSVRPAPNAPAPPGLGIGLAVVKSLVEMHGGQVEARSEGPGLGSEFVVWLPLARAGEEGAPPVPAVQPAAGSVPPRRILVVDDRTDQAESLRVLLRLHGHEVDVARDAESALAAVARAAPDVALIDVGLPGASGYEVARRIRERPELSRATLVAQTGWGEEIDRRRAEEAGFTFFLAKPVELAALNPILAVAGIETRHPA